MYYPVYLYGYHDYLLPVFTCATALMPGGIFVWHCVQMFHTCACIKIGVFAPIIHSGSLSLVGIEWGGRTIVQWKTRYQLCILRHPYGFCMFLLLFIHYCFFCSLKVQDDKWEAFKMFLKLLWWFVSKTWYLGLNPLSAVSWPKDRKSVSLLNPQ